MYCLIIMHGKCGLAIKPETSHEVLEKYLDILDYILIMSVSPGFGGQGFIEETLLKMKSTHEMCVKNNFSRFWSHLK